MADETVDAMMVKAEEILALARNFGVALGLQGEPAAMPILLNAAAMAAADLAGPDSDRDRLERVSSIAANQLFDLVPAQWALRTRKRG
jgi:hypothetical protein